jgi:hypothetical protein
MPVAIVNNLCIARHITKQMSASRQLKKLNAMIDSLPSGPQFKVCYIQVVEDLKDENGKFKKEDLKMWYCNPVELV